METQHEEFLRDMAERYPDDPAWKIKPKSCWERFIEWLWC